jgi:Mlc titration factor MtfA (ptsG expression regulator)
MIPDTARIRATRRWALGEGLMVGALAAVIVIALVPTWPGGLFAGVVGGALLAGIYRGETRIVRRRLAVMARPFPAAWEAVLRERIPYYASLEAAERARFQHLVALFLDEKPVHGVGCAIDDTCRLLVAASAIIPVFAFPGWEYTTLRKVLIRPEAFDAEFRAETAPPGAGPAMALGMVGASGWFDGVMILSLPDLLAGFAEGAGKHNVGIHEFAHLIDRSDGAIDGVPATLPRACLRPWTTLVHEHLAHRAGADSGLPAYGYTNEAEFFAVASEYFFQSPAELARRDPPLYALLERVFRQDMLARARLMEPGRAPRG